MNEVISAVMPDVIQTFTTIVVAVLGSTWFNEIMKNKYSKNSNKKIAEKLDEMNTKIDDNERRLKNRLELVAQGQMHVLQDRLLFLSTKYLERGYIYMNELKSVNNMYSTYHELDGNDFITELYERVKELPIKKNADL